MSAVASFRCASSRFCDRSSTERSSFMANGARNASQTGGKGKFSNTTSGGTNFGNKMVQGPEMTAPPMH